MKLLITLIGAFLFSLSFFCYAVQIQPEMLKQLAAQYVTQYGRLEHVSSVSISVLSPGDVQPITAIYSAPAVFPTNTKIDTNSLWQIGSITKSFVAVRILQLTRSVKGFSLTDPITKYFPHYKKWQGVTVENLLNMTSGIPDYFKQADLVLDYAAHPYQTYPSVSWVNKIYKLPLLFKPGTQFSYSNTNYLILGLLIEKLTHNTLQYEIQKHLLEPIHLTHTTYIDDTSAGIKSSSLIHGYQYEQGFSQAIPLGTDVTSYNLSYLGPSGAMLSTSTDVTVWVRALFLQREMLDSSSFKQFTSLLSEHTAKRVMQLSPQDPNGYGLGISAAYSAPLQTTIYLYQGMTLGYRALFVCVPTKGLIVTIFTNSSYEGRQNHLMDLVNHVGALVI